MKAIRIKEPGGPQQLELADVAEPAFGPDEVRVRVRATAINRADLLQTLGQYPAPRGAVQDIPGLEFAGEVDEVGARVTEVKPGDPVMGLVPGGAFAQKLVAHERELIPVSGLLDRWDFARLAAIPEAFTTAFDALVLQAKLSGGETVLIHAAASGVGTAASQLARAFGAASIGTSRSNEKLEVCRREHGLDHGVVVTGDPPAFAAEVRHHTSGRGADVVLELVGGRYLPETIDALATRGRVMVAGLMGGASQEVDFRALMGKRASITGTVLRSRALEEKIAVAQAFRRQLLPLFAAGALHPVVDRILPVEQVREAFEAMRTNATVGKVVLTFG